MTDAIKQEPWEPEVQDETVLYTNGNLIDPSKNEVFYGAAFRVAGGIVADVWILRWAYRSSRRPHITLPWT